jgi:hypothetical protein
MNYIDVKRAIQIAKTFIVDVFPESANDIRLEEVELVPSPDSWLITFSFPSQKFDPTNNPFRQAREYKTVQILAETGELRGIKIRELHG